MDCFLDMLDNRECLALDMVERLVQNLGENEQAKEGTYDVEIGLEYYLGYLQMVGGPLEAHPEICKQESQDTFEVTVYCLNKIKKGKKKIVNSRIVTNMCMHV